jgi:hypothetical protein
MKIGSKVPECRPVPIESIGIVEMNKSVARG